MPFREWLFMYMMHAIPGMEFSGSCSENSGGRFAQVVGCHPENGSSYSVDGILYELRTRIFGGQAFENAPSQEQTP